MSALKANTYPSFKIAHTQITGVIRAWISRNDVSFNALTLVLNDTKVSLVVPFAF